jgi:hypothetical protein
MSVHLLIPNHAERSTELYSGWSLPVMHYHKLYYLYAVIIKLPQVQNGCFPTNTGRLKIPYSQLILVKVKVNNYI